MCKNTIMHTVFSISFYLSSLSATGQGLAAQHLASYHCSRLYKSSMGCPHGCQDIYRSARANTYSRVHASYDRGVVLATARIQALPRSRALRQQRCCCIPPCSVQAEVYPVDLPRLQPLPAGRAAPGHLDRGAQAGVAEHVPARSASPARSGLALARAQPGGAQVRRQRAPARPARHLRHGLQAYGALRVGLCRRRQRLRRGKRQRQHPRPL